MRHMARRGACSRGPAPQVQALLQQRACVLRLLVHGRLGRDHAAVLLVHGRVLDDLRTSTGAAAAESLIKVLPKNSAYCSWQCSA
jgi:hypothetical protein